uniref:Uncharacterized protein n=1 Tax=Lygus hesperus TaxID=30085 RepID=A0A146L7S2_LYGHE
MSCLIYKLATMICVGLSLYLSIKLKSSRVLWRHLMLKSPRPMINLRPCMNRVHVILTTRTILCYKFTTYVSDVLDSYESQLHCKLDFNVPLIASINLKRT